MRNDFSGKLFFTQPSSALDYFKAFLNRRAYRPKKIVNQMKKIIDKFNKGDWRLEI